jgi:hypothetical protein
MSKDDFNEENLPQFVLPQSFLNQLFDMSGSTEGTRGFLLAFVNQDGSPMIYTQAENQIVEMGLRKAIEKYLIQLEESEFPEDTEIN